MQSTIDEEKTVLIFNLDAITLDVSIVTIYFGYVSEVITTDYSTYLGEDDFDNQMINFCVKIFTVGKSTINPKKELP